MTLVKKQHYVPQFYLQRFTGKGGHLRVYDKFTQKSYAAGVRDVASSHYFYDLSLEQVAYFENLIHLEQAKGNIDNEMIAKLLNEIRNTQMIEKHLSHLENHFVHVLENVVDGLEKRGRFKSKYRAELALLVALQFWRTEKRRESMMEMEKLLEDKVMYMVDKINDVKGTDFTANDLGIKYDPNEASMRHKMFVFDMELLESTAEILANHIWILGINQTPDPLYTSDNPVALRPRKPHPYLSNSGYASPGIEIAFPLSPKYILVMGERNHFREMESRDGIISYLTKDKVLYYNSLQIISSYRQIYSATNKFSLAEKICEALPVLKTPRSQWE